MYDVVNLTPFKTAGAVLMDVTGEYVWTVIVKATFRAESNEVVLADAQEPVTRKPDYRGEPGLSSLRCDTELCPCHPGTDVVVDGTAHAPNGRSATTVDVRVQIGDIRRDVRVHGDRVWRRRLGVVFVSDTEPFATMPVTYERAFGGARAAGEPDRHYAANPVGVGFYASAPPDGAPLPNVEDPRHPIASWNDRPPPAGVGAIDRAWPARLQYAGTYDEQWQKTRAPLWPSDVNPRFFSCASPGLHSPEPLRGGEPVLVEHMTPDGRWSFRLPSFMVYVRSFVRGRAEHSRAQLDRVLLLPEDRRVTLTWRAVARCGDSPRKIDRSTVWAYKIDR
jgi:hypothetical protein